GTCAVMRVAVGPGFPISAPSRRAAVARLADSLTANSRWPFIQLSKSWRTYERMYISRAGGPKTRWWYSDFSLASEGVYHGGTEGTEKRGRRAEGVPLAAG